MSLFSFRHRPLTIRDHEREARLFKHRINVAVGIILCMAFILLGRLSYLQMFSHNRYRQLSQQNQVNVLPLPANRGLIFDRHGVLLAENIPTFSLEVVRDRAPNLKENLTHLKKLLKFSNEELKRIKKRIRGHRRFESVVIKQELSQKEIAKFAVNQYRYPGFFIRPELLRRYPHGEAIAHVLGYVGQINAKELATLPEGQYRNARFIGKLGIEKFYEKLLHGKLGYDEIEADASGHILRRLSHTPTTPGYSLRLSIDLKLQQAAMKALANERGAVVAIEPSTGEVLALVSNPTFNPNEFVMGISEKKYHRLTHDPDRPLFNRAIRGQYPLASTIKPFIALKGLDEQVVTPHTKIYDKGWYQLPGSEHVYHNWRRSGHGWVDFTRAMVVSNDTYFFNMAEKLGIHRIAAILQQFGFGQLTQIDTPQERPGLLATPAWKIRHKHQPWYAGDTINTSIGQGFMLATPLQLAHATATLALRGEGYVPHLLHAVGVPDQPPLKQRPVAELPITLVHPWVWDKVIDAMQKVVTSYEGTGFRYGRDVPYTVAVKTGTAQVYSLKKDEEYEQNRIPKRLRDHSLFIGFAPVENPKIAIAVVVENNSYLATVVARKVIDTYLKEHRA